MAAFAAMTDGGRARWIKGAANHPHPFFLPPTFDQELNPVKCEGSVELVRYRNNNLFLMENMHILLPVAEL